MKKGTVCGCDGLSIEFYEHFLVELFPLLWEMYQVVLTKGKLGQSGRRGIITLLPKKGKDPRIVKNLCPITLLNTEYKILAKTMANRLKTILPEIISDAQSGFMEGRQIHDNVRRTIDIISHVYQANKKAVIVSIDYEKCFDRLEYNSILKAMEFFNFGKNFTRWSSIFFNGIEICIQNAGYTTEFIKKERGCNQGCNYSPFCFNLCGEIMAILICNNPEIKGVKMGQGASNVISQFADDTTLFLMYEESCINAVLRTLALIEVNTGLKISYEKTKIYRIGSLRNSDAKCYTIKPIIWSDEDIDLLGFKIRNAPQQSNREFDTIIEKMSSIVNIWHNRNLSLIAKVLLVNSLMGSLYVYKMSVLPLMSDQQVTKIHQMIGNYLWGNKKNKIP